MAHIMMLKVHERKDPSGAEGVTQLIERAVAKFRGFGSEIQTFSKEVSRAEHLLELQRAEKGFSALFWLLVNTKPGTEEFYQGLIFVERLCAWCFETLIRADRILERYFEIKA